MVQKKQEQKNITLEEILKKRIFGQNHIIESVVDTLITPLINKANFTNLYQLAYCTLG